MIRRERRRQNRHEYLRCPCGPAPGGPPAAAGTALPIGAGAATEAGVLTGAGTALGLFASDPSTSPPTPETRPPVAVGAALSVETVAGTGGGVPTGAGRLRAPAHDTPPVSRRTLSIRISPHRTPPSYDHRSRWGRWGRHSSSGQEQGS